MSLQQIQQENKVFRQAYESGKINKAEYDQAMAVQRQREQKLTSQSVAAPLPVQSGTTPKSYVQGNWQPVTSETPKTEETQRSLQYSRSVVFWTQAGYPQYAGKYPPVNVPPEKEIYTAEESGGIPTNRPPLNGAETGVVKGTWVDKKTGEQAVVGKQLQVTVGPKITMVEEQSQGSFFGPSQLSRPATEAEKAELKQRYVKGENIYGMSLEEKAIAGLTLATGVVAPVATAETLVEAGSYVAGQALAIGIGEVVTGGKLTPSEIVGLAAIGTLGVQMGRSIVQSPRARAYVSKRINASYEQQIRLNEAVLSGKPLPEGTSAGASMGAWKGPSGTKKY
jgi:hypothetical protein